MEYVVIIERGQSGYGAYVPDLPGCVAAADSRDEVRQLIEQAIRLHVEDLRDRGSVVPVATSSVEVIKVA